MGQAISKSDKKTKPDFPPFENYQAYPGGQSAPGVPGSPMMYCNPDYVSQRMMPGNRYADYYADEYGPIPRPRPIDPRAIDPRAIDPRAIDPRAIDPRAIDLRSMDPRSIDRMLRMEYLSDARRQREMEDMDYMDDEDEVSSPRRGRIGRMQEARHLPRHRIHEQGKLPSSRALSPVPHQRPHHNVSPPPPSHIPQHSNVYQPTYGIQPTVIYYDPANGNITATSGSSTVTPVPYNPPIHGTFAQQQLTGTVPQTYVVAPLPVQPQSHAGSGQGYSHHPGALQRYG